MRPRNTAIIRWCLAVAIGGGGLFSLARVMSNETNWLVIFAKSLFGLAAMITGVLLVAPEVVRWALAPCDRLLDHIFLPSETLPPPVDYTLARRYYSQLRYAEAGEEYSQIIRYHPRQIDAYLEGIQAANRAGEPQRARRFYQAARRHLRAGDHRLFLERASMIQDDPARRSGQAALPPPELGSPIAVVDRTTHGTPTVDRSA